MRRPLFLVLGIAALAVVLGASLGFSAANTVPTTHLGQSSSSVGANALKPSQCSSLVLAATVSGSDEIDGTAASELLLGSAEEDEISGGKGDDCLVGGGDEDELSGGGGTDVCVGGPGTDSFSGCETAIQ